MWQRPTNPMKAPLDGFGHQHASATSMDISRPDLKVKKRRRQVVTIAIGVVVLAAVTFLVMRLKPAAPNVDRSAVWTDTVKRGPMVRPGARTRDPGAPRRRDPPDPGADRGHRRAHPHPARLDRKARHHPGGVKRPDAEPGGHRRRAIAQRGACGPQQRTGESAERSDGAKVCRGNRKRRLQPSAAPGADRQDAVQPGRDFRSCVQRLSRYGGSIEHS